MVDTSKLIRHRCDGLRTSEIWAEETLLHPPSLTTDFTQNLRLVLGARGYDKCQLVTSRYVHGTGWKAQCCRSISLALELLQFGANEWARAKK